MYDIQACSVAILAQPSFVQHVDNMERIFFKLANNMT